KLFFQTPCFNNSHVEFHQYLYIKDVFRKAVGEPVIPPPSHSYINPCSRQLSKIGIISCSASATASSGVISPRAALANMLGMINVPKTSPMAALAGPGCPITVDHDSASLRSLSLSTGREPNGSTSSQPPSATSCGEVLAKAGKL